MKNPISDPYEVEDRLARELQRRKVEEEKKRKEIERICAESEEIKLLKQKVQTAYVTKERALQLEEQQQRRIQELKDECLTEAQLLKKRAQEVHEERLKEQARLHQRLEGKYTLQKQMVEHQLQREEAMQQYLHEKGQVNSVVQRLIEEDRALQEEMERKKKLSFQDMQKALSDKDQQVRLMKQKEWEENQKYLEFMREKDRQAHEIKLKKLEENEAKDKIFQKLKEEEERRRYEQDLLTDLRFQLYQEQYDANLRQKDIEDAEKRERQKREMQQAEIEARERKQRQKEEEARMEIDFRDAMMRKFALDDKLEQQGQQKRRMMEHQHKQQVEKLWKEKLAMYQMEKEKELQEHQEKKRIEQYKAQVVEEERQRILRDHLSSVGDYAPKGLLMKPGDTQILKQTKPAPVPFKLA